jgi:hypothetical protein
MTTTDERREQGVEFGDLADDLEAAEYPVDKPTLLERYGEREIAFEDATRTLSELLEPLGEDRFESAEAVRRSVLNVAGDEAVGREGYSDRGGQAGADGAGDPPESA